MAQVDRPGLSLLFCCWMCNVASPRRELPDTGRLPKLSVGPLLSVASAPPVTTSLAQAPQVRDQKQGEQEAAQRRALQWQFKLMHSPTHLLAHSLTRTIAHSLTPSLTHFLTHSHTQSLTHSLTHSLAHALTHSLAHPLTHSLTHPLSHLHTRSLAHSQCRAVVHSYARNYS